MGGDEDDASYWRCEFCFGLNVVDLEEEEIPQSNTTEYMAVPPPVVNEEDAYSNVVFCIDVSGSMCVTSELGKNINLRGLQKREERNRAIRQQQMDADIDFNNQYLPGQRQNVTFVSRLQCVQSAIDHQISRYQREQPQTRIGLVSFSNEVTLIGDGTQTQTVVAGDRLYNWDQLQENGATALGPALQLSIAIAGSKPGSQVILCTDGLANIGLGSLEGKETEFTPYYTELAEQAKLRGVSVSVISLIGSECCLENLCTVTEQT